MSLSDYTKRALISISVDSNQAEKELKDLTKAVDATGKSLDATAGKASQLDKALDAISLGKHPTGLSRLGDAFKGLAGRASTGLQGLDSFAKGMGKLNPVLDLGAKGLDLVNAGLEAYAKTSPEAAAAVEELTGKFASLKDSILSAYGAWAVSVYGSVATGDQLKNKLIELENTKAFKAFFGGFNKASYGQGFLLGDDETQIGFDKDKFREWRDTQLPQYLNGLDAEMKAYDKRAAAQKRAREESARFRSELAALASQNAKDSTDALVAELEGTPTSVADLNGGAYAGLGAFGLGADSLSGRLDFKKALQGQLGAYDSGGFVDEMAKYSGALEKFADAASVAYETIASGSGSVLQALISMGKAQLLAIGKLEVVEAIRQLGLGFGSLANPLTAGEAALHFKSAATHGAAAAAAGLGIAALGVIGGGGGGGGASAGSAGGSSLGGSTQPRQVQTTQTIYIVQGDSFSEDSPRMRQRKAERVVALGTARASSVTGDF